MSKNSKQIKGTIVGEFWCKKSKTGDTYLSGKLTEEYGETKVTLIKKYSKENEDDSDYVLLTYKPETDFDNKKVDFSFAPTSNKGEIFDDSSPDFSQDELERWLSEKEKRRKK